MQQNSQPNRRHTPGKRRQSRNNTQSPAISAHKAYSSENDASDTPSDVTFHQRLMPIDGPPRTPHKSNSPAPSSLNPNSQPKTRGAKSRSKNVSTSPGPAKPGRRTPPQTAVPNSIVGVFAGGSFHASPAPSSLPMPSFFAAKATAASPGPAETPQPVVTQEPSPPPTDSEMPTPLPRSLASKQPHRESPLELFFRADRAEKARRASSANALGPTVGPFSPPSQPASPYRDHPGMSDPNISPVQQNWRQQAQRIAAHEFHSAENLSPGNNRLGPAFSTPYSDRIKAARSTERAQITPPLQHHHSFGDHMDGTRDRSKALKDMIFGGQGSKAPATTASATDPSGLYSPSPSTASATASWPPAHQILTPPASEGSQESRSADVRAMENHLRNVLKLDSLSMAS